MLGTPLRCLPLTSRCRRSYVKNSVEVGSCIVHRYTTLNLRKNRVQ